MASEGRSTFGAPGPNDDSEALPSSSGGETPNQERHRREGELFHQARELPPDKRQEFLDRKCADEPELRASVEALLAEHEDPLFGETETAEKVYSEAASDPIGSEAVRYCIRCGWRIDSAFHCTNPDCGLPNVYRDVPAPQPCDKAQHARAPGLSPVPPGSGGGSLDRETVPIDLAREKDSETFDPLPSQAAVGTLEGVSVTGDRQLLYPGKNEIGARPPARILLDHPKVSGGHACILCEEAVAGTWKFTIIDQGSTNGTFVNGEQIDRSELREGDRVRFATMEYIVRLGGSDEPRFTIRT